MSQISARRGLKPFMLSRTMLPVLTPTEVPTWVGSPAEFDRRVYEDPEAVWQELEALPKTPLVLARQTQAAYIAFDRPRLIEVIPQFEQAQGPLYPGLFLWITAFAPVAAMPDELPAEPPVHAADLLSLENACCYAAGMAHLATLEGRLDRAGEYLLLARTLSRMLGMNNRTQNLVIESGRLAMLRGRPTPELLRDQLLQPMPQRRFSWTQRTLAESDMTVGDYQSALHALGTPEDDCELSGAMREFLHVLLGLPPLRELQADGPPYMQLALALRRLGSGTTQAPLGLFENDPESGYAALIESTILLGSQQTVRQGFRQLISRPYDLPDQRAHRAVLVMKAIANGQYLHAGIAEMTTPWREYAATASLLTSEPQFLDVIRRFHPETFALMALGTLGTGRPGFSLSTIPLLIGKVITYQGREIKTPGRTGRCKVLEALALPSDDLTRADQKRYRQMLIDEGLNDMPIVNIGWVARGCLRLTLAARVHGQANDAAAWRVAHQNALEMMTPCVQEVTAKRAVLP